MSTSTVRMYITGNSYPVKDQLKGLGARWDADRKAWWVSSEETAKKCQEIVANGGSSAKSSASSPSRPRFSKCRVCGVAASRYVRIYGSGECRDCFEERKMGY